MDAFDVYKDIQIRTNGQFLVGVVGPVRTGKSTFIRRFMEVLALPNTSEQQKKEIQDQLPLSGSGKLITTVEPKFIPKEAMKIELGGKTSLNLRLIDCVGFLVPDASGNMEDGKERMVKTPWFEQEIPFHQAAEVGTRKVIQEHSTIGIVITSDGSFGEIPRENFVDSEERTITELKKQGKPFVLVINSQKPYRDETVRLVENLEKKYHIATISMNCQQLRKEDIVKILETILYQFPITQIQYYIPKWLEMLSMSCNIKDELIKKIQERMGELKNIRDIQNNKIILSSQYIKSTEIREVDLSNGIVKVKIEIWEKYYYQMISQMTGVEITGEYQLMNTLKKLASMKKEYDKVLSAMEAVRGTGYGVVIPEKNEIKLEEPMVIRQGNKYGVKIKSSSPSIHMIKATIETEIAPIVGSEEQAKDLMDFIKENEKQEDGIWQTNIFGKTVQQLVEDGIHTKTAQISEESQVKLQDTMQKIVNDSKGGLICIII